MAVPLLIDRYSRWQYSDTFVHTDDLLYVEEREPFEGAPDIAEVGYEYIEHTVVDGDTLFSLAGYYYHRLLPRACALWWAIAEANEIVDPTQKLVAGMKLVVPDYQYVLYWLGYRHEVYV